MPSDPDPTSWDTTPWDTAAGLRADSEEEFRAGLRAWVLAKAEAGDTGLTPEALTDRTPLFEERHLTSLHVPELLLLLERLTGAEMDVEELSPRDFRDIEAMTRRFATDGGTGAGAEAEERTR